jgi:DNA-binding winged helix-turn-helix (wHTH) protein
MHALLERLKPGGAATVLRRLLESNPNLSSEAEKITRSLLFEQMHEEVTYYNFGPFCLDAGRRILRKEGKKVDLDATPMEVLLALVESEGNLVSLEDFREKAWHGRFVVDNNLDQQISILRKALGEGPKDKRYIRTVPRRGYQFVAPVTPFKKLLSEPKSGFIDERTGDFVGVADGTFYDKEPWDPWEPAQAGSDPVGIVPPTQPGHDDLSPKVIMEHNNPGLEEQRIATVDGRTQKKRRHSPSRRTKPQLPPAHPKKKGRHSLSPPTKSPLAPAHPTQRSRRRHR